MKNAKLIDNKGLTVRQWLTDDVDAAMTAARNCPVGWHVVVA